jgi:hypothetical protein
MDELRAGRGVGQLAGSPRESVEQWLEEAGNKIRANGNWIPDLMVAMAGEPRPLTNIERAGVDLYYRAKLNELDRALARRRTIGDSEATLGERAVVDSEIKVLSHRLTEFENTLVTGGMNNAQVKMAEDLPYMRRELALANEELVKMTAAEKPNFTAIERKRISIEKLTTKIGKYEASLAGVLPVTERVTKTTYGSNEALAEMFAALVEPTIETDGSYRYFDASPDSAGEHVATPDSV